jgi:DNA-binding CsgD family transcriptional regulator
MGHSSYLALVAFVTRLGQADIDRLLMLVREAAAAQESEPFGAHLIERLVELIPADRAGYYEYAADFDGNAFRNGRNIYSCERPVFDFRWWDDSVGATIGSWPLRDWPRRPVERAMLLSDFLSRRQRLRNPWYLEVQRPRGVEYECKLLLPSPAQTVRGFFFVRGPEGHDFNERDRAVLTMLRPHLHAIREDWEGRNRPACLTARETEVLRLVAEGLTNAQIAARLVISPATVRSHLAHVFEKLGVQTRTAAVAAAFHLPL